MNKIRHLYNHYIYATISLPLVRTMKLISHIQVQKYIMLSINNVLSSHSHKIAWLLRFNLIQCRGRTTTLIIHNSRHYRTRLKTKTFYQCWNSTYFQSYLDKNHKLYRICRKFSQLFSPSTRNCILYMPNRSDH